MDQKGEKECFSRRDFVKGTAVAAACSLWGLTSESAKAVSPEKVSHWDEEADVVIVGYGAAGGCAAIAAHDAGARVVILEKMPAAGGNSGVSGAAILIPDNMTDAVKYYRALSFGTADEEMIRDFAESMVGFPVLLKKLGIPYSVDKALAFYPNLPGASSISKRIQFKPPGAGKVKFKALSDLVEKRRIKVLFDTSAKALIQNSETKEVEGVKAERAGKEIHLRARRGVVLASGGYEFSQEMLRNFNLPGVLEFIYPWGSPGNTGDGIKMALGAGGDLWHMSSFEWGPLCVRPASKEFGVAVGGGLEEASEGSFMFVNRYGKRFMDERKSMVHQRSPQEIVSFDGVRGEYSNLPAYMIFDEAYRAKGPIVATPEYFDLFFKGQVGYWMVKQLHLWSNDNASEVAKGWIIKSETIKDLARKMKIDAAGLADTIQKFNNFCAVGKDDPQYGRYIASMAPLKDPPFYAVEIGLTLINTQGGPKRNRHGQVLGIDNKPIPRLYTAGELGSFFGWLYQAGTNFAEAWTSGYAAGKSAASQKP